MFKPIYKYMTPIYLILFHRFPMAQTQPKSHCLQIHLCWVYCVVYGAMLWLSVCSAAVVHYGEEC